MKKFLKNKKEKPIIQHVKSELENEAEELSKKYSVWIKAYENGATISAVPYGFNFVPNLFGGINNYYGRYKEFDDDLKILIFYPEGKYGKIEKKYKVSSFEKAVSFVAEKIKEFYDSEKSYDEEL